MDGGDVSDILAARGPTGLRAAMHHPANNTPMRPAPADGDPVLVRLADVCAEPVRWAWPGRIPLGMLTVLDGDPGLGKSLLTLDLAARVSTGAPMPDDTRSDLSGRVGVVVLSAEDDLARTIRPRLDAAGADVGRIASLTAVHVTADRTRAVTLADVRAIDRAIADVGARLVIIDPFMAYVGGKTDSHRDSDIRGLLAPLTELAGRTGAAIVIVRHLRKSASSSALYSGGGSIGIIGAARSGLLVAADREDPKGERRLLAASKSNLASLPPTLAYRLVPAGDVPRVEWMGTSGRTADELVGLPEDGDARSAMAEAEAFLCGELAAGPRLVADVQAVARRSRIADRTLRRARENLRIAFRRDGDGSAWRWHLPDGARGRDELGPGG